MKFSFFIRIEDLRVDENKGVKDFDLNITQEMSNEEFVAYVEMVPQAITTIFAALKDANAYDTMAPEGS